MKERTDLQEKSNMLRSLYEQNAKVRVSESISINAQESLQKLWLNVSVMQA